MIPFFQFNILVFGPIIIQVWGLLVACGLVIGLLVARYWAKKLFLSVNTTTDFGIWGLVGGVIGARLGHVLFYEPVYYWSRPIEVLFLWLGGMSALGGIIGALLGIIFFAIRRGFKIKELVAYLDVLSLGFWLGWGIGRMGCFLIHDHPGKLSNFFLAVKFSEGTRLDLGLLESLLALLIWVILVFVIKKIIKLEKGKLFLYSFFIYSVARFGLDFLRAQDLSQVDVRYGWFTPMQWGIIVSWFGLTVYQVYSKISAHKS